jgi:hypothetical protein
MLTVARTQSAQTSLHHWMRSRIVSDLHGGQRHVPAFPPPRTWILTCRTCRPLAPPTFKAGIYSRSPRRQFPRTRGQGLAAALPADLSEIGPSPETTVVQPPPAPRLSHPQGAASPEELQSWKTPADDPKNGSDPSRSAISRPASIALFVAILICIIPPSGDFALDQHLHVFWHVER